MDFTLSPEIEDIRLRTRRFIEQHVLPLETERANYDEHENIRLDVLRGVQAKARAEGLWAPQAPKAYGGMALPIVGWAAMYEEANRSIFGPLAFNCAAPDDGNMNLLALVGTDAQKDKWLRPIVDGKVRSSFAMTEPAPGGGSDPGMIRTRAEKKGDAWVIHGHKWFITGAGVAEHFILLALTGTKAQKDKWLAPIVAGEVRSSFAMTEPAPGGGSDPGMIRTRAEKKSGGWVIHGHKWFITGAGVADHFILIARTSDDARRGLTAFLYHRASRAGRGDRGRR